MEWRCACSQMCQMVVSSCVLSASFEFKMFSIFTDNCQDGIRDNERMMTFSFNITYTTDSGHSQISAHSPKAYTSFNRLTVPEILLPYPQAAKQTRPCATSAPCHSVLPSTITPESRARQPCYRAGRDLQRLGRTAHAGSFGSKQHVGVPPR